MIEDYAVRLRTGRSCETGEMYRTKNGKVKRTYEYRESFQTAGAGNLSPEEWRERAMEEITACGEAETYERVKEYCVHFPWLHTEKELVDYAIDCTCSRAYEYWQDFEQAVIWM